MSNPKLKGVPSNGGGKPRFGQVTVNSLCPLPLIGWKPSSIRGPDGQPDQPTPVLCMGPACRWFVQTGPVTEDEPQGSHQCAPAAVAVVISQLPGALAWWSDPANAAKAREDAAAADAPPAAEPAAEAPAAPEAQS